MQDQDAPPVEEGETGGGVVAVPKAATPQAAPAAINSTVAFTALLWTIAIVPPCQAATMAPALGEPGQVSPPTIPNPNPSRYPCARMPRRVFLALLTISSSRPRFRRPLAS